MIISQGNPDRRAVMKKYIESADGKFRYQVILDFMQNMPKEYLHVPTMGNIASGCTDINGNIYCALRGGSFMSPYPLSCWIMLDKDGNFVRSFGQGVSTPTIHMGEITPGGKTILAADYVKNQIVEIDIATGKMISAILPLRDMAEDNVCRTALWEFRMHKGISATEPSHEPTFGGDPFYWYLTHKEEQLALPFCNPTDVAFDSFGNLYVSDGYGNVAIHKYDSERNYIKSWGGSGYDHYLDGEPTPGKFVTPHSITVDRHDHVWVCDRNKDAVHVFDTEGNLLYYRQGDMGQPSGVDCNSKYIYVVGRGGYLTIFDTDFHVLAELGEFNGDLRAHAIACDEEGNLYLFPTHANTEHQVVALKVIND